MMQQLLQITSTPIEYQLKIEPARLEFNQADNPKGDISQQVLYEIGRASCRERQ